MIAVSFTTSSWNNRLKGKPSVWDKRWRRKWRSTKQPSARIVTYMTWRKSTLSACFRHDRAWLRQPLTVIRNYSEGLRDILHSQDYDAKLLEEALKVVDEQSIRASSIIEHMRGLIKGKESKVREVDLNSSVPSILETYKELGGKYEVNLVIGQRSGFCPDWSPLSLKLFYSTCSITLPKP